ncbi:hypothetical protein [Nostoc phage NMeng1]|nr:hypothetical protein [Nostoc phage NMeng1]
MFLGGLFTLERSRNAGRTYGTSSELRREARGEGLPCACANEVRRSSFDIQEERRHVRLVFDPTERRTKVCPAFGRECKHAATTGQWCEFCRGVFGSGPVVQGKQRDHSEARAECEDRVHRVRRGLAQPAETGVSPEVPRVPRFVAVVEDAGTVTVYLPVSDDCGGGP